MRGLWWYCRQVEHLRQQVRIAGRIGLPAAAVLLSGRRQRRAGGLSCRLERFQTFEGVVQVAGRIESLGPEVVGVGLRLPSRRWGWVEAPVDPCPSGADEPKVYHFAFSAPGPSGSGLFDWVLRAALADGSWVELPTALPDSLGCEQIAVLPLRFIDDLSCRRSGTLLEIGGRARSAPSSYRPLAPPGWRYVSFDIVDGPDVDVVGDAHELSSYFDAGSIDAIVSASVFEHLAMPWKAVLEMNRVLAPGGTVLTTTHQAWPLHEQPWDFWRYSDASWHALFNESTGFRLDQAAMGQPADGCQDHERGNSRASRPACLLGIGGVGYQDRRHHLDLAGADFPGSPRNIPGLMLAKSRYPSLVAAGRPGGRAEVAHYTEGRRYRDRRHDGKARYSVRMGQQEWLSPSAMC